MSQVEPSFTRLLAAFSPGTLHGPAVVCGLWADGRIGFINDAWLAAATDAVRPETCALGSSYFSPMGPLLEPFYRQAFGASLRTGLRWDHAYLCNTPDQERQFSLSVFPLGTEALLTVHTVARLRPAPEQTPASAVALPLEQCPHCRRVRTAGQREWQWVGAWIRQPPPAQPLLCEPCSDYYRPA